MIGQVAITITDIKSSKIPEGDLFMIKAQKLTEGGEPLFYASIVKNGIKYRKWATIGNFPFKNTKKGKEYLERLEEQGWIV